MLYYTKQLEEKDCIFFFYFRVAFIEPYGHHIIMLI